MLDAPNCLAIEGGLATDRFAVAVLPVPPLVEVTFPVVLVYWPETLPATFTTIVQLAFVAMLPPVRLMVVLPAVAVAVPPQVLESPCGVATTSPVGSVSVKATPVSATVLAAGLVRVKVNVVVPLSATLAAPKALAMEGGATTVTLADAVPPAPPSVEVTLPVVLFSDPAP